MSTFFKRGLALTICLTMNTISKLLMLSTVHENRLTSDKKLKIKYDLSKMSKTCSDLLIRHINLLQSEILFATQATHPAVKNKNQLLATILKRSKYIFILIYDW